MATVAWRSASFGPSRCGGGGSGGGRAERRARRMLLGGGRAVRCRLWSASVGPPPVQAAGARWGEEEAAPPSRGGGLSTRRARGGGSHPAAAVRLAVGAPETPGTAPAAAASAPPPPPAVAIVPTGTLPAGSVAAAVGGFVAPARFSSASAPFADATWPPRGGHSGSRRRRIALWRAAAAADRHERLPLPAATGLFGPPVAPTKGRLPLPSATAMTRTSDMTTPRVGGSSEDASATASRSEWRQSPPTSTTASDSAAACRRHKDRCSKGREAVSRFLEVGGQAQ